jgi:hypothetical protein
MYRFYFLGQGGRISMAPILIDCSDDRAAIQRAKALLAPIEVWEDTRLVVKLSPKQRA